eukprot:28868-Amphidinium_carterae.1
MPSGGPTIPLRRPIRGAFTCHKVKEAHEPVQEYEPFAWRGHICRKTLALLQELSALQGQT